MISNAWWSVDMFEPSAIGVQYVRTMRFAAPFNDREAAIAKMCKPSLWRGNESECCNLTPPRQLHTPWPERGDDWRDDSRWSVIAYRPSRD